MCRCKRQEHSYLLAVAKALRGKKGGRGVASMGRGGGKGGPLDPLAWGRQKNRNGGGGDYHVGPELCKKARRGAPRATPHVPSHP